MKQPWYTLRLLVIVLCATFAALGPVAAQDEDEDSAPQPTDIGTPGLVDVANNLNLPTVPPPPNAAAPDSAPQAVAPPILPDTPTVPVTDLPVVFTGSFKTSSTRELKAVQTLFKMRAVPRRQSPDVVWSHTDPTNGITINVFSDATFVLEDKSGLALMTGYFGIVGVNTLVAMMVAVTMAAMMVATMATMMVVGMVATNSCGSVPKSPLFQNIHAIQNRGEKQPDPVGKMRRLIYRWKRTIDGMVLRRAGGLNPG